MDEHSTRLSLFLVGESSTSTIHHVAWRGAWDRILIALAAGSRVIALLGPPGVGKTLMLTELAAALRQRNFIEVARPITLIDNADRLDDTALRHSVATDSGATVFAARPDFAARLRRLQADAAVVGLAPLREPEVLDFASSIAEAAGQSAELVDPDVAEALFLHTEGIPRRLSALARVAFLVAYSQGASRVDATHVEQAASLRALGRPPPLGPAPAAQGHGGGGPFGPSTRRAARPRAPSMFAPALICIGAVAGLCLLWWPDDQPARGLPAGFQQPAAIAPLPAPMPLPETPLPETPLRAPSPGPSGSTPRTEAPRGPGAVIPMPPRVIIQYSLGNPAAQEKASRLAATLRAQGLTVSDPAPEPPRPGAPEIRYFFSEDQSAAELQRATPAQ